MQQLFKNKIVALSYLVKKEELLGFALVSKDNAIFFDSNIDIIPILKQCKRVIYFDYSKISRYIKGFDFKDDLRTLYFQCKPEARFKNLQEIIKREYFVEDDKGTTYLNTVAHKADMKKCIIEAKFIYQFYKNNYKKVNKEILKIDNTLCKEFSKKKINIQVDRIKLFTLLSFYNKRQWDLERLLWNEVGFPFLSISQLSEELQEDEELLERYSEKVKIKAKASALNKYQNSSQLDIDLDFTGSSTGRIICRDNFSIFSPDNDHKDIFTSNANKIFASFDYSRQEVGIISIVSEDGNLIKDLKDENFYSKLASSTLGVNNKELGKNLFYGLIYGSTTLNLAKNLGISLDKAIKAKNYLEKRYKKMIDWLQFINKGTVESNFYNRPLYTKSANAYIQSTAADLVRTKLIETLDFDPVLVFSDNIIYELDEKDYELKCKEIKTILESHSDFKLLTKQGVSKNLKF